MDTDDVFTFHAELELSEGLHEGHALNVPNHTSQLSNTQGWEQMYTETKKF